MIGPNADSSSAPQGDYFGRPPFIWTPLAALQERAAASQGRLSVSYVKGCDIDSPDTSGFGAAEAAAADADATVIVLGLDTSQATQPRCPAPPRHAPPRHAPPRRAAPRRAAPQATPPSRRSRHPAACAER